MKQVKLSIKTKNKLRDIFAVIMAGLLFGAVILIVHAMWENRYVAAAKVSMTYDDMKRDVDSVKYKIDSTKYEIRNAEQNR